MHLSGALRNFPALLKVSGERWFRHHGQEQAAAIAFYALLSLAPMVLLVLAAASWVLGETAARTALIDAIAWIAGPGAAEASNGVVEMVAGAEAGPLTTVISVLLMVHFSSMVFLQLRGVLNRVWRVEGRDGLRGLLRGVLYERLVAWVFVPLTLVAAVCVMVAELLMAIIVPFVAGRIPGSEWFLPIGSAVVPLVLVTVLLAALYRLGPGTRVAWSDVWPGAALVALLLTAGSAVLGAMIARNMLVSLYGAAGALVVLMLWVFYGAHLLLYGAYFSHAFAERHGSLSEDADPDARPQAAASG